MDYEVADGTVLDEPMLRALLYSAVQEGLLDDDPTRGDGFVRQLTKVKPPEHLLTSAFEHLVLGGRIYAPFWIPRDWPGELVERGILVMCDTLLDEDLINASGIVPSIGLAMLRDRGMDWSYDQLEARYDAFVGAEQAWREVSGGKSYDALQVRMAIRGVMPISPEDYSNDEIAAWNRLDVAIEALRPILNCHRDCRLVLTQSLRHGALSSLPVDNEAGFAEEMRLVSSEQSVSLLRIACKRLRRVPFGTSLRETLAMASSPEAEALRQKLAAWTTALRTNQVDPAILIQDEIDKARDSLQTAKTLSRVGEYSTVIGVPASVAGLFVAGPLVAVGGLVLSVAGGVALAGQKLVERLNRWAMFG